MSFRWAGMIAVLCCVFAGCGSSRDAGTAPIACTTSVNSYLSALRAAPAPILLDKQTPISECLVSSQAAGDQAEVGQKLVAVATELNHGARRDPGGKETVELGYLLGAVEQGSSTTGGIHQDLVRRLQTAANYKPGGGALGPDFEKTYDEGYAAGQETG